MLDVKECWTVLFCINIRRRVSALIVILARLYPSYYIQKYIIWSGRIYAKRRYNNASANGVCICILADYALIKTNIAYLIITKTVIDIYIHVFIHKNILKFLRIWLVSLYTCTMKLIIVEVKYFYFLIWNVSTYLDVIERYHMATSRLCWWFCRNVKQNRFQVPFLEIKKIPRSFNITKKSNNNIVFCKYVY